MKYHSFLIKVIALAVIILLIGLFFLFLRRPASRIGNSFLPTPTPIQIPGGAKGTTFGNVQYDQKQTSKMIENLDNRPSIPPSDTTTKTAVVNSVGNDSGTVNTIDNEYRIDYLKTQDLFQVEIDTTDIQKAKTDAVAWLRSQGFSQEGICKLPVTFYINFDVKQQLPKGTVFNPLPDGC